MFREGHEGGRHGHRMPAHDPISQLLFQVAQHEDQNDYMSGEEGEDLNFELHGHHNFNLSSAHRNPRRQMIEEIDNDDEDEHRIHAHNNEGQINRARDSEANLGGSGRHPNQRGSNALGMSRPDRGDFVVFNPMRNMNERPRIPEEREVRMGMGSGNPSGQPGSSSGPGGQNMRSPVIRFDFTNMDSNQHIFNPRPSGGHRHSHQRIKADPEKIETLMAMGFTKSQCKAALKRNNNNIDRCIDKLLENGDQFIGVENSDDSGDGVQPNSNPFSEAREERKEGEQIQPQRRPGASGIVPSFNASRNMNQRQ